MDTIELKPRRAWRRHSAEFKAGVIEACRQPGVSVASVALAHGLNANLLRNWLVAAGKPGAVRSALIEPGFLPLTMPPPVPAPAAISIEIRRGGSSVQIHWPLQAAAECGSWLTTWLK